MWVDGNSKITAVSGYAFLGRTDFLADIGYGPWDTTGNIGSTAATTDPKCLFLGDSTTYGTGGSHSYATGVTLSTFNGRTLDTIISGTPGDRVEDIWTNINSAQYFARMGGLNIMVVWLTINDLNFGYSPAVSLGHLSGFCQHQQNLGWTVVVGTLHSLHPSSGFTDSDRVTLNGYIRAQWAEFASGLFDVGNDATLGPLNANPGTGNTYFNNDAFHLTDAGYSIVAGLVQTACNAIIAAAQTNSSTSGYSGYSGKSGYSGYSGPSGFSGYSGYSGYSGISGFSGYSGYSGYSGAKLNFTAGSTSTVSSGYASNTYLAGSGAAFTTTPTAGSTYYCKFDMVKTGAGTATPIITMYWGTNGSTSDTSLGTITFGVGTGVIDTAVFEVWVVFRTVGSGTSATVLANAKCAHALAATGMTTTGASGNGIIINGVSSGFNSSGTTNIFGLGFNGGTSFSGTCTQVYAYGSIK